MNFLVILVFSLLCLLNNVRGQGGKDKGGGGGGKDNSLPPVDDATFNRYKDQVCNAVPAFKGETRKNFTFMDEMTEDEVYELAFMNMAYGLTSDAISHLQEDMGYRKRVLDLIALITKQSCLNDVVPEMYLNAAKNLFLYYLYKKERSPPTFLMPKPIPESNSTYKERTWTEILSMLEQCSENVHPIPLISECDIATHITLPNGQSSPIVFAEERIDIEKEHEGHEFMDEIVDAVWWMFSTTYARCYTMYYPREDWVIQFLDNFSVEFLSPFALRWKNTGPMAEYFPIIFGPFDFRRAKINLRSCNGAAYQYEGIAERQLVRPLSVSIDGITMLNFKVTIANT